MVNTLPTEPAWAGKRVNYGKDRCAYIPKSQQAAAQAAQAAAAQSLVAQSATLGPVSGPNPFGSPFSAYPFPTDMTGGQGLNRTVYLGNIHPETTTEDLCNAIRGGVLQSVRYMQDKHIAVSPIFPTLCVLADLLVIVRYLRRPCGGVHVLPSGILSGAHFEQPAAKNWLGEEFRSIAA